MIPSFRNIFIYILGLKMIWQDDNNHHLHSTNYQICINYTHEIAMKINKIFINFFFNLLPLFK